MKQICFLPYLEINKEFNFGDVIFWPFWRLKSRRIQTENILKYLEWYFKKWKDNIFNKRINVTIASLKGKLLGPFSDEERERIQVAANILFLLSAPKNNQFFALSADNFILYTQNFVENEYKLVLCTGSYIQRQSLISSRMVNKVKFIKPDYIPRHNLENQLWFSDMKYYRAIKKAFSRDFNESWFVRLRRSLTPFLSSYSNIHSINYFDRIISLITAIEVLLDVDTSSSYKFVKAVKSVLGFSNRACRGSRSLVDTNRNIRRFSDALYKIRSKFVHGKEMTENDVDHPRFGEYYKTGVIFYYELIKCLLENNYCIRKRKIIGKKIYFDFSLFPYAERNENS